MISSAPMSPEHIQLRTPPPDLQSPVRYTGCNLMAVAGPVSRLLLRNVAAVLRSCFAQAPNTLECFPRRIALEGFGFQAVAGVVRAAVQPPCSPPIGRESQAQVFSSLSFTRFRTFAQGNAVNGEARQ